MKKAWIMVGGLLALGIVIVGGALFIAITNESLATPVVVTRVVKETVVVAPSLTPTTTPDLLATGVAEGVRHALTETAVANPSDTPAATSTETATSTATSTNSPLPSQTPTATAMPSATPHKECPQGWEWIEEWTSPEGVVLRDFCHNPNVPTPTDTPAWYLP